MKDIIFQENNKKLNSMKEIGDLLFSMVYVWEKDGMKPAELADFELSVTITPEDLQVAGEVLKQLYLHRKWVAE